MKTFYLSNHDSIFDYMNTTSKQSNSASEMHNFVNKDEPDVSIDYLKTDLRYITKEFIDK